MARHSSTTDNGRSIYIYGAIPTNPTDADANSNSVHPNLSMAVGKIEQSDRASHTIISDYKLEASSAPLSSTASQVSLLNSIRSK